MCRSDEANRLEKKRFFSQLKYYYWEDPYLYKRCADQMLRTCAMEKETEGILMHCHTLQAGGHHGRNRTGANVLESGFYWLTILRMLTASSLSVTAVRGQAT